MFSVLEILRKPNRVGVSKRIFVVRMERSRENTKNKKTIVIQITYEILATKNVIKNVQQMKRNIVHIASIRSTDSDIEFKLD